MFRIPRWFSPTIKFLKNTPHTETVLLQFLRVQNINMNSIFKFLKPTFEVYSLKCKILHVLWTLSYITCAFSMRTTHTYKVFSFRACCILMWQSIWLVQCQLDILLFLAFCGTKSSKKMVAKALGLLRLTIQNYVVVYYLWHPSEILKCP